MKLDKENLFQKAPIIISFIILIILIVFLTSQLYLDRINTLNSTIDTLNNKISDLNLVIKESEDKITGLTSTITDLESTIELLNSNICGLEVHIETQEQSINDLLYSNMVLSTAHSISFYKPDTESVEAIAKTLYGECYGIDSITEQACVAWCILNRVDAGYEDTIYEVVTAPNQFLGYSKDNPLIDELVELATDVMQRWLYEKDHPDEYCGRVLPKEYLYFLGDGKHNWFTIECARGEKFDYSLVSPYES